MSPKPLGSFLTCTVLLTICLCLWVQVDGFIYSRRTHQRPGGGYSVHEWLNRKDVIKKLPLDIQKAMLNKVLNQENVQLTGDLPPQLDDKIPEMVEYLVNGAIDVFFNKFPGVAEILRPFISVGINYLKRLFGGRRVYIPDMPSVIKCPANQIHYADKGRLSTVVTWTEPFGTDAEDGTLSNVRRTGKAPGSRFSGEDYIKYEVSDSKGKTDFCMFAITIKVIRCPPIPLEQHKINTCKGVTRYGDECTFSCSKGYTLVGQQKLTCTREGQYDWQAPTCRILHCPVPVMAKPKVKVDCGNQFSYGSTCTLYCPRGLTLQGSQSITCETRGETNMYWAYSGSEPDCAVCKLDTQSVDITSKRVESFRIDNLKPDTDYVFIVYAMNENGRGEVTAHNIRTKPAAP